VKGFVLDTNIVSHAMKQEPSTALSAWLADQSDERLFISSLTVAEIWRGVLDKPEGRKRDVLVAWFNGPDGPPALFAGRVLPFDERAALVWARLMSEGRALGRPRSALDMIIASIAVVNDCVIATDNSRDFAGLDTVNPLRPAG